MCRLTGVCALVLLAAPSASADVSIWAKNYANGDIAKVDIEALSGGTPQNTWLRVGDDRTVFTLSADVDWTGKVKLVGPDAYNNNPIVFDFTDGNHTISYGSTYWPSQAHVTYRGGYWNTTGDWRLPGYGTATGRTVIFDNTTMTCSHDPGTYFWGANGNDNVMIFTNGAVVTGNSAAFIQASGKRNLFHLSTGSRVEFNSIEMDRGTEGVDYGYGSNTVIVTGTGTYFYSQHHPLTSGRYTSGDRIVVSDHAVVSAYGLDVGGWYHHQGGVYEGQFASNNTMTITDSISSNKIGMCVGATAGASHNTFVIRNSDYSCGDAYSADEIGRAGSYNEALFENINFLKLFRISCGICPGANHNTVTVRGATKIANSSGSFRHQLFGQGQYNTQIFDGYSETYYDEAAKKYDVIRASLALTENGGYLRASTNNTVKYVNGSQVTYYTYTCSAACASNTVAIEDSDFGVSIDFYLYGDGNTLVLDDSTFRLSQSGGNLLIGNPNGREVSVNVNYVDGAYVTRTFVDRNNRFVIRGTHPKVVRIDPKYYSCGRVYSESKMVIEVPEEGYDQADLPIFDQTGMTLYGNSSLEIQVPEKLMKAIDRRTTYKLMDAITVLNYPVPEGSTRSGWEQFLLDVNAQLPKGCEVYASGGNGSQLWLRIRPSRGLVMVLRRKRT